VVVPNAFTPDGNGINDTWSVKNFDFYINCTVNIYNRYGERVYSSIGDGIPWDGTYSGKKLPTGPSIILLTLKTDLNFYQEV
jgi:gliding motility-associated-like protein